MQSCLTSEWLECLGCIHSLGWSWHQTGTFGVQGLFLKIMFSPWSSMWSQTYVRPKQEAGLIIVVGVQVVPYQGPPLQHLRLNLLLWACIQNNQSHFQRTANKRISGIFWYSTWISSWRKPWQGHGTLKQRSFQTPRWPPSKTPEQNNQDQRVVYMVALMFGIFSRYLDIRVKSISKCRKVFWVSYIWLKSSKKEST